MYLHLQILCDYQKSRFKHRSFYWLSIATGTFYFTYHILTDYHAMFRASSATPSSRIFISICLAADNIAGYDVWWIDNPIFNYNPHTVLSHRDVHKTRSLFKIRIPTIRYQSRCQTAWHLRKFIGDIGITALDITTQVTLGRRGVADLSWGHSILIQTLKNSLFPMFTSEIAEIITHALKAVKTWCQSFIWFW